MQDGENTRNETHWMGPADKDGGEKSASLEGMVPSRGSGERN